MSRVCVGRVSAILLFLALVLGAVYSFQRLMEDIAAGRYFVNPEQFRYDIVFLVSYILISLLLLRYGYYLAINRVNWEVVKDDFLYLLNKRYFSKAQWILNILLFWSAFIGFVYSLVISAMRGSI